MEGKESTQPKLADTHAAWITRRLYVCHVRFSIPSVRNKYKQQKWHISRNNEDARTISSTSHKVSHCVRAETANSTLVAWPLNKSEAGVELILIETFLFFGCHESLCLGVFNHPLHKATDWNEVSPPNQVLCPNKEGNIKRSKRKQFKIFYHFSFPFEIHFSRDGPLKKKKRKFTRTF